MVIYYMKQNIKIVTIVNILERSRIPLETVYTIIYNYTETLFAGASPHRSFRPLRHPEPECRKDRINR